MSNATKAEWSGERTAASRQVVRLFSLFLLRDFETVVGAASQSPQAGPNIFKSVGGDPSFDWTSVGSGRAAILSLRFGRQPWVVFGSRHCPNAAIRRPRTSATCEDRKGRVAELEQTQARPVGTQATRRRMEIVDAVEMRGRRNVFHYDRSTTAGRGSQGRCP